jgi:hypothetical protein
MINIESIGDGVIEIANNEIKLRDCINLNSFCMDPLIGFLAGLRFTTAPESEYALRFISSQAAWSTVKSSWSKISAIF